VQRALHYTDSDWLLRLGTALGLMVRLAQLFVTERGGEYNMSTSGWAALYFSPSSAQNIQLIIVLPNPSGASAFLSRSFSINLRIREGFGGLCARQRCKTCLAEHDICCAGLFI